MNTMRILLLFLFMAAVTNTSFAGQGDDGGQAESDCDYISGVDTFQYFLRLLEQCGSLRVAVILFWAATVVSNFTDIHDV